MMTDTVAEAAPKQRMDEVHAIKTKEALKLFVFDLDGTLANGDHRLHYICNADGSPKNQDEKDWESFFAASKHDAPIQSTIEILKSIAIRKLYLEEGADSTQIIILTARNASAKEDTELWISEHLSLPTGLNTINKLIMRPTKCREQDDVLKIRQLREYIAEQEKEYSKPVEVVAVFEDRSRVVDAWRQAGFHCHQVASGDF